MGAPDLKQERRRFSRAVVDLSAICSTARETAPGIVRDLSLGGAFVQSDALLPVGAKLRVGLVLPDEDGSREWIAGRVVRVVDVVPDGSLPGVVTGMGVEFRLTAEQRERLARVLARTSSAPPAPDGPGHGTHRPSTHPGVGTDEVWMRLDQMRAGQSRSVRLRLVAIHAAEKTPTDHFLEVKVFCQAPGRLWDADVKADFGRAAPVAATVTLLKDRYEASSSLPLVERGVCVEQEIPLPLDPSTEKLVFWVVTDGSAGVPEHLACAIRVHAPAEDQRPDELDTLRLPSIKTVLSQNLAEFLLQSPDASLVVLGELMQDNALAGKLRLLERLVESGADLRLVEAGVRDIELWERVARGFGQIDFGLLQVDDPVDASLVVFHAHSAPRLLVLAFAASFESHITAYKRELADFWGQLALAAAVALCRRDRVALADAVQLIRPGSAPGAGVRLEALVGAAERRLRTTPVDASTRLGDYADDIRGQGLRPPFDAAVEFMAAVGLISLTAGSE
jgi:hypothetical protein